MATLPNVQAAAKRVARRASVFQGRPSGLNSSLVLATALNLGRSVTGDT